MSDRPQVFVVARNPDADSKLPYLLSLPLEGELVLKARESWPATARVYCHRFEQPWPEQAELIERTPVLLCRRRGAAIDLLLDRLARSQFVFTQLKGREAIFWQIQKTVRSASPGGRIPRRRTLAGAVTIAVDTRERYPYRFNQQERKRRGRRFPPVTTPSTHTTAPCSPRSSARASRTSPPHSPTERSPSRCNAWQSSHSPP